MIVKDIKRSEGYTPSPKKCHCTLLNKARRLASGAQDYERGTAPPLQRSAAQVPEPGRGYHESPLDFSTRIIFRGHDAAKGAQGQ